VHQGLSNAVLTIRPTLKLAKRLRVELLPEAPASITVLGDWYCSSQDRMRSSQAFLPDAGRVPA
jgi:hypothetical protein